MSLRILQLNSARAFGGGERHLVELCRELTARGHALHLAHRPQAALLPYLTTPTELHPLPLRNAFDISSARRLALLLREHQIDLLHAHLARDYPLAALATQLYPTTRLIITRHVMFPLSRWHKFTLRRAARVIAVSAAVARQLQTQHLVTPDKIRIIPNGIDLARFAQARETARRDAFCARWQINPAHLLIGALGDLNPRKGPDDFLRAAAVVAAQRDDITFLWAGPDTSGNGADLARLKRLTQELGLTEKVRFLGWSDDTVNFYDALALFVSASHTEAFGLTIVEAMAAGLPVVATRTAGAGEIISEGKNGRLAPLGNPLALAEIINEMLAQRETRNRFGAQARLDAHAGFGLMGMTLATEAVYRKAINQIN